MAASVDSTEVSLISKFADYLAEGFGCSTRIEVDATDSLRPRLVAGDRDEPLEERSVTDVLSTSVILCRLDPARAQTRAFLARVCAWLDGSPAGVVVADSDARMAPADLRELLCSQGLDPSFWGWAGEGTESRRAPAAILERNIRPQRLRASSQFRVVAFMPAYNEADIIVHALQRLIAQDIDVYVIDNWSTDGTWEKVQEFVGRGVLGAERFPPQGALPTYEWRRILGRVESLAATVHADWFILLDPDERRYSPWRGTSLKAGLQYVDRCGFNCIDHIVLNHWPTGERLDEADDVDDQLRFFTFSDHPGHFHQRRAWKNMGCPVSIAPSAGHDVTFPDRRVYPFKFLLRHFPIRSQAQAERKLFVQRRPRWNAEERSFGWHQQYDGIERGESFERDPSSLKHFEEPTFHERYLIERLSGIGVFREPPPWATPPR